MLIHTMPVEKAALDLLNNHIMHCDASDWPMCLPGTREKIRQDIITWITTPSPQNILWLHGLAGSGKSTIAMTIAQHFYGLGRRGGFLFFKRALGHNTTGSIVRSLAAQLADSDQLLRSHISMAVDKNRQFLTTPLHAQFEALLFQPLKEAAATLHGPIVIVIDALDEYGDIDSRKDLLPLIVEQFSQLPPMFRFLITSRPEQDIVAAFEPSKLSIVSMHLTADTDDIGDIRLYVTTELTKIAKSLPESLRVTYPGEGVVERLSVQSEGLFIWASLAMNILRKDHRQLERILSSKNKGHQKPLDMLYTTALEIVGSWHDGREVQFREAVSIVLFSSKTLNEDDVDQLLELPEENSCHTLFSALGALFDIVPGTRIRPLHASFRDYLTDPARSNGKPWSLVDFDAHGHLTACCLRLMSKHLHFNMAKFDTPYRLNMEYKDLGRRITENISPTLQYATTEWLYHLISARCLDSEILPLLKSFSEGQMLFWLEVVNLLSWHNYAPTCHRVSQRIMVRLMLSCHNEHPIID